jgi:leucine-zipper-like transcriptional regulator 1
MTWLIVMLLVALVLQIPALAQDQPQWVRVTEHAAFTPRDTAEDAVFLGKMWLSNAYNTEGKLTRDLWNSTDGVTWTKVLDETPYDGYSEMVVYHDKLWAIKGSVWNSSDGVNWTQVCAKTPFGTIGYGECVVFQDKIWQLGGASVWNTSDGVTWNRVLETRP